MIVLTIQNAPPKLRGYLTKYMWQLSAGVYVGNINARVRKKIWERVCEYATPETKAILVFSTNTEQGFQIESLHNSWKPVDFDGLQLILNPFESKVDIHNIEEEYIVLDLETTGLNPTKDSILEIGALLIHNGIVADKFECIIKCNNIPENITVLTGITQEMSNAGIDITDALKSLNTFVKGKTIIGYNIQKFDLMFILIACKKNGLQFSVTKTIDVLPIIRKLISSDSYKLRDISKTLNISILSEQHRALQDCYLCKAVYDYCKSSYRH